MNWKIKLSGDKKYLEDLASVLETLNFVDPRIRKEKERESEEFFLEGTIFESSADAKEVSEKAKTFLTLVSVVPHFKTQRVIETPKIAGIIETLSEANKKNIYENIYDSEGNYKFTKDDDGITLDVDDVTHCTHIGNVDLTVFGDGKILAGLNTIESVRDFLSERSSNIEQVAEYLKSFFENIVSYSNNFSSQTTTTDIVNTESKYGEDFELAKWSAMRNIFESISNDLGGRKEIYKMIGEDFAENFYRTACYYYTHPKNKPKNKDSNKNRPPKRKMPLSEAEEVISTLVSKYIGRKVKESQEGVP